MVLRGTLAFLSVALTALLVCAQTPAPTDQVIKYPLTEREGPWLIHIGSFRGDDAYDFAHRFAEETRTKHRYLTFVYSMHERDALQDREQLRQEQLKLIGSETIAGSTEKQKLRTVRVIKEYSVFVGNYPDMEKARVESVKIKELPPPTSIPSFGVHLYKEPTTKATSDPEAGQYGIFGMKATTRSEEGKRVDQSQGNPYRQSFVVRNPMLRDRPSTVVKQNAAAFDPSWRELNAQERHSIFTCPKNWTLVVATCIPPSEMIPMQNSVVQTSMNRPGKELGKGLELAADNARKIAELLRDGGKGYDAYVFHTRHYSVVTVGAFEARNDPNMERAWTILRDFAATQNDGPFSMLLKVPQPMQIPGR